MTRRRFILSLGLLSACTSQSGDLDAGQRPDGAPIADAGPTLADGATMPGDSSPGDSTSPGPPESEFLEMARRACAEICRCSPQSVTGRCTLRFPGCTNDYSGSLQGCILDFVERMEVLKLHCSSPGESCHCQWFQECRHWALTVACDPAAGFAIEMPSQCLALGGPPSDRDPTCEQGPLRQCDAGVR